MIHLKRFILIFSTFLLIGMARSEALEIAPDSLAFQNRPGKTLKGEFSVFNESHELLQIVVETVPLFGFEKEARVENKDKVSVSARKFSLAPRAHRILKVRYRSSRKESVSEKAVRVTFTASQIQRPWLKIRLSHVVYVVPKKVVADANLDFFDIREETPGQWHLRTVVSNHGTVHLLTGAMFRVQNPEGGVIKCFQDSNIEVLCPNEKVFFEWTWKPDHPPEKNLDAWVSLYYRPPFGEVQKMEEQISFPVGKSTSDQVPAIAEKRVGWVRP